MRPVSSSGYLLSIGGEPAVTGVKSAKGGFMKMTLAKGVNNAGWILPQTSTQKETTEFEFEIGASYSQKLIDVINQFVSQQYAPVDITITRMDARRRVGGGVDMRGCIMTECTIGALDSEGKEGLTVKCKFKPEYSLPITGGATGDQANTDTKQRDYLNNNFAITCDPFKLGNATKIEALTFKAPFKAVRVGAKLGHTVHNTRVEHPALTVKYLGDDAGTIDAHQAILEEIGNGKVQRYAAGIEVFGPDNTTALFSMEFRELMLFEHELPNPEHGKEEVEAATLKFGVEEFLISKIA